MPSPFQTLSLEGIREGVLGVVSVELQEVASETHGNSSGFSKLTFPLKMLDFLNLYIYIFLYTCSFCLVVCLKSRISLCYGLAE